MDNTNNDNLYSTMVRSGKTTYFVDVRKAKNGSKYLSISETRFDGDDKRHRSTLRVFKESADQLRQAIDDAVGTLK
jgi:hypothetical protein